MWKGVLKVIVLPLTAETSINWLRERSCRLNQPRVPSPGGPKTGPHTTSELLSVFISMSTISPTLMPEVLATVMLLVPCTALAVRLIDVALRPQLPVGCTYMIP